MGSQAPLGTKDLWNTKGVGLPGYVREIARSLMRDGRSKSQAIQLSIGIVRNWAEGKGNVTEKTRAKAARAVAQFEAARAKAKATPNKGGRVAASHARDSVTVVPHGAAVRVRPSGLALAAGSKTPPFTDSKSGTTTVSKTDADDPRVKAMADKLTAKGYDRERAYKVATAIIRRRRGAKGGRTSTAAAHTPDTALALAAKPAGADSDRKTGGMIALVPSAADLERLTVDHDNAEAPADLHVTLNYIGPDVTGWDQQRTDDVLAVARRTAEHLGGPITARAWAHATFNPDGGPDGDRDPCAVYLIGDATTPRGERDRARYEADAARDGVPRPTWHHYDPIADAHSDLKYAVPGVVGPGAAQQHQPFVPHLTGGYGMTADDLTYTGPITFDRIAVHLAGERHEFPLVDGREDEEEARLNAVPMRAAHGGGRRLALGQGPSCKCGGPHQLVFYANRSTPAVVHPGDDAPQQKGYGKVTGRRKATAAQEKQIAKGEWIRVDQGGKTPSDSGYKKNPYRPQLVNSHGRRPVRGGTNPLRSPVVALAAGTDTPAVRNPTRSIPVSDSGSGPSTTTNSTGKAPSGIAPAMKAAGKGTNPSDKVEKAAQALIAKGWSRAKAYAAARKLVAGQTSSSTPAKAS